MILNAFPEEERDSLLERSSWIICGHQVNLIGGPLFVLYKWISTLVESQRSGCTPLFYMEGNDSDFAEISKICFVNKQHQHQTVLWDAPQFSNRSCGLLQVDHKLRELLCTMLDQLLYTEYTEWVREIVLKSYQEGVCLPEATSSLVKYLFPGQTLYCFDATCPKYLQKIRFILENELDNTKIGKQANVWVRKQGIRTSIFRKDLKTWVNRKQQKIDINNAELLPNYLMRSICQDYYFQTKKYIQGNSEAKYMQGMENLYTMHQIPIPQRSFRMNPILVTQDIQHKIDALQIPRQEFVETSPKQIVHNHLIQKTGTSLPHIWHKMKNIKSNTLSSLIDLGLSPKELLLWEKKCYKDFRSLFSTWKKQRKQQYQEEIQQIKDVSQALRPQGAPQAAGMHIICLLNQYGIEGIQKIQDACRQGESVILLD